MYAPASQTSVPGFINCLKKSEKLPVEVAIGVARNFSLVDDDITTGKLLLARGSLVTKSNGRNALSAKSLMFHILDTTLLQIF